MGLTSLQVCIDSTDWLQGSIHVEHGMDSSISSPSGDMLTCSRPLIERRLRPQQNQALKCPRCDSTHTKFCYYNNYSLSQPRYFCKTCRRYWTKGGTLRNIPVGGGCRKNKKVSKKPSNDTPSPLINPPGFGSSSATDLHLSSPHDQQLQLSHLNSVLGVQGSLGNPNFLENEYNGLGNCFDQHPHRPVDFMENKFEAIMGSGSSSRVNNYDLMGNFNGELGVINNGLVTDFHGGFCSPYGMPLDGNYGNICGGNTFTEACQRLMLPYDHHQGNDHDTEIDVKPNTKLLALYWHDQGMGSWSGMMNGGYGPSTSNPLM